MDTRTKILTAAALPAFDPPRPVVLAAGRFDLLRVELARELAEARRRTGARTLIAVVRPLSGELAPIDARAEMAAALRVVDYVFIARDKDLEHLAASLQPVEIVNLEEAEARRVRQLIENVHGRQSG
jgi:bifunctional ADP-heptose synthase (sugar kinase/adenylyltransferase)